MNGNKFELLHSLLAEIKRVNNESELNSIIAEYAESLDADNDSNMSVLLEDARSIGTELISLRNAVNSETVLHTEQERAELDEVRRIIDENLFDYHFQPIVNTSDGAVYSYEALMRPRSSLCPSPYHVIKYAEITDRLDDIERATFVNILNLIGGETEMLFNRPVFINSIPSVKLSETDFVLVKQLLAKNSDRVVVEMTEQSEMADGEFGAIKEMYNSLNIRTAIDDYGTGYSNVQNLLRYMPDFVKIDRSILSDIHNNSKKRYFVREIIDFCHENGILALAEGVETTEELQTVIHLGADLVQGYYTARPSAAPVEAIPYEIRQEIKLYRQEREDGKKRRIYTAEKNERVLLDRLEKEEYKCVLIGKKGSGEVTAAGSPGIDSGIHIDVANDFKGRLILSDAMLSNVKNRPCISIGENCDVELVLSGSNYLNNGGIKVPESSRLHICGEGELSIFIDGAGYYAIGNDSDSRHGELVLEQGVSIESHAAAGVCIGSGLGGKIRILKGQFTVKMTGYMGVGIGAFDTETDIEIFAGDITVNMSTENSVAIGSFEKSCYVNVIHSAVKVYASGTENVGIGTLRGESCKVSISEASATFNMSSDNCSAIAALNGKTQIEVIRAGMHIVAKGDYALALGGYSGALKSVHTNSDTSIEIITKSENVNCIDTDKIEISGGRAIFTVNGKEVRSE
ncbi:MAG: EAL domain-containing protein [Oscillospiraceae bacterium]|nr:EAL domain-containing protein [Oscillospiraceae bacterium]